MNPRAIRVGQWALAAVSVFAVAVFVIIALLRLRYPYELEWLESGVLEHVRRIHDGAPLYTQPSQSFVEFGYSPLYVLVSGLLSFIFGVHFSTLRVVSLLSTFAIFALLYRIARIEGANRAVAILAIGLFAACFHRVGGWFDVGKPDSLFLALALWSLLLVRQSHMVWAGLVVAMAVLTKQTAVFVVTPVVFYLLITRWRDAVAYVAPVVVIVGGTTIIWQIASHGWFVYYVWQQLGQQGFISGSKFDFWRHDLRTLWPLALVAIAGLAFRARNQEDRWNVGLYVFAVIGMIAGSWISRLHEGGFDNVLMPACAAIVLLSVIGAARLVEVEKPVVGFGVIALCALQFFDLRYNISAQIPTAADRKAGDEFIAQMRVTRGDILVTSHPTYAIMAGKQAHAQQGGVVDVLRAKDQHAKDVLRASYTAAFAQRKYAAIIIDGDIDADVLPANWKDSYTKVPEGVFETGDVFRPVTSPTGHPEQIWLLKGGPITGWAK